jgi:hypothetical protein
MSTIKTKNVQVGTDSTASNNFTIYVPGTPDGTVRIGNGDAGAVTDAVTINSSGAVTLANNLSVSGTVSSTGDVAFDTDTLYVDATNNRVGIGTSTINRGQLQIASAGNVELHLTGSGQTGSGDGMTITANSSEGNIWLRENGYFRIATNNTERMRIDSSGKLLVGTSSSIDSNAGISFLAAGAGVYTLASKVNSTASSAQIVFWNPNGPVGSVNTNGTATSFVTSSDYRLKEDWVAVANASTRVNALKPINFAWKVDGSRVDGFLAHELAEVVPEAVTGTKDAMRTEEYEVTPAVLDDDGNVVTEAVMGTREVPDYQGIDQSKLVPLLTAALQEAITKIEDLETRIQTLEAK